MEQYLVFLPTVQKISAWKLLLRLNINHDFFSGFLSLLFFSDCIPWAESFPYENHHSQARTSLQVAGGKTEAFFSNLLPPFQQMMISFATFAKKQVTGCPERFWIGYSFRSQSPNFSALRKVLWPTKWGMVAIFYWLFLGRRFGDNNKSYPAHYSCDFIRFTQSIFEWWKSILKFHNWGS